MGAGCDFLTPIGHQCNTLVFGPGGYRFSDYARLGAPLSVLVVLVGTPLILWAWPLHYRLDIINPLPSGSRKRAKVPQGCFSGGPSNSTPRSLNWR